MDYAMPRTDNLPEFITVLAKWPHVTGQPQPRHFSRSHERRRGSSLVDALPAWWIARCHRAMARGAAVKRLMLALAVAITALTCHAKAADLRPPVTAPLAPAGAAYDWSGFYAGVHAGGSWADNEFFDVNAGFDAAVFTAAGVFGGGQIGFNWQTGRWVLGAELEGSLSHLQRGVFGPFCGFGFGGLGCGGIPGLPLGARRSDPAHARRSDLEALAAPGSSARASRRSASHPAASAMLGIAGSST
jgi:hypothetical protein